MGSEEDESVETESVPPTPSPGEVLRADVLEYLVDLWEGQRETIRLAKQWSRYEEGIDKAAEVALRQLEDADLDVQTRVTKASESITKTRGLSRDQKDSAFRRALQSYMDTRTPRAHGRTGAALRSVTTRRRDLGLLSSQLVTLVADFELFVLRVTTAWLDFDPQHLSARKKELSFEQLGQLGSIEDIRTSMVNSFLEEHMRKSASAWFGVFCELFKASKLEGADDFTTLEIFQRRHVVVHHGGLVSRQYLAALDSYKHDASLGDHLAIGLDYVKAAADSLGVLAHSIALAALYASTRNSEERLAVEREAGELTYLLLNQGRATVVRRYVEATDLQRVKREFSREQIRVNGWIARRRLGDGEAVRKQVQQWDVAAKDLSFKLAKKTLLGETEDAVEIAQRMIDSNDLSLLAIQTWPLFEEIRDEMLAALDGEDEGDEATSEAEDDVDSDAGEQTAPESV